MKFYKFKKLGILGTIFLLCTTCFLSGRISVANADGSNAVLPVAKGGTGANSASEASTNILGTNFANYSDKLPASQLTGSVPIANGGTGA
ncbi:MAG: hypothetical protein LBT91_02910, partial [Bifidobacteriaceae bacterium]|nr:hypothetical protein [Bifidobacteriaceae bacterium]